jgi:hypothetical protein
MITVRSPPGSYGVVRRAWSVPAPARRQLPTGAVTARAGTCRPLPRSGGAHRGEELPWAHTVPDIVLTRTTRRSWRPTCWPAWPTRCGRRPPRTRRAAERPSLDPFSTAPFRPARRARPEEHADPALQPGPQAGPAAGPPQARTRRPGPRSGRTPAGPPRCRRAAPRCRSSGAARSRTHAARDAHPDGTQPSTAARGQGGERHRIGRHTAGQRRTAAGSAGGATRRTAEGRSRARLGQRAHGTGGPRPAGVEPALRPGRRAQRGIRLRTRVRGHVPAPRFPSDPAAPFPLEDAPAGLMDAAGRAGSGSPPWAASRSTPPCPRP